MRTMCQIKLGIFLVAAGLFSATAAIAETVTKEDLAPGTLLNRYSGLAGAWWLDTECRFLSDDQKREFA